MPLPSDDFSDLVKNESRCEDLRSVLLPLREHGPSSGSTTVLERQGAGRQGLGQD